MAAQTAKGAATLLLSGETHPEMKLIRLQLQEAVQSQD
jgi:hypothetical protein